MSRTRREDHALDILLREELGGELPPDLSHAILAKARRRTAMQESDKRPGRSRGVLSVLRGAVHAMFTDPRGFASDYGVWGVVPALIALALALVGFALILGGTGAAPFIYTMF